MMNRREALEKVSYMLGGTLIGASAILNSSFTLGQKGLFDKAQIAFLNEVGETIWPETDTPGARQADVGAFMSVIVRDCYTPSDQKVFTEGIATLDQLSRKETGKSFMQATPEQRTLLLTTLDQEAQQYMLKKKSGEPAHYFRMMKELTLAGYYTSEIGATKFLKYNPAPGRYDGCTTERPW